MKSLSSCLMISIRQPRQCAVKTSSPNQKDLRFRCWGTKPAPYAALYGVNFVAAPGWNVEAEPVAACLLSIAVVSGSESTGRPAIELEMPSEKCVSVMGAETKRAERKIPFP